ncbi:adenosine deaminase [Streptacidiphilus sp. P02-A3a]|uniref:adenosine deaminase n=1 Tax=Streptacidiphilus sp. P02-A3a TaxID=2704468 RepID=UPI0015FDBD64|nr:adenosine deaminase [Streptacidiphilus sp. P02-A3a]QMU68157.1 adenosine deaminase [Streptacidiphilus sp. P02-A3a]
MRHPLPKAELHLHIEGTLEPELAFALAERNRIDLPYAGPDELRAAYAFTDLQSFLDLYYQLTAVLLTEQDFTDLADGYLARAAEQGVRHAEIFFDPQAHTGRGVDIGTVIRGLARSLESSRERFGVSTRLILSFLRDLPAEDALKTLADAGPYLDSIAAVGLDSAEVGHPPAKFAEVYAAARAAGLRLVAHAGEEGPPEYITEALDVLGVERIDHGIRCMEDPALVERLVAEQVPLTVCPFSNVRLRCVDTLADHPLPAMLEAGLLVTVNSDDPSYFGGYVEDNVQGLRASLGLSDDQLALLARNSFLASFVDDARRAELLAELDAATGAVRTASAS